MEINNLSPLLVELKTQIENQQKNQKLCEQRLYAIRGNIAKTATLMINAENVKKLIHECNLYAETYNHYKGFVVDIADYERELHRLNNEVAK